MSQAVGNPATAEVPAPKNQANCCGLMQKVLVSSNWSVIELSRRGDSLTAFLKNILNQNWQVVRVQDETVAESTTKTLIYALCTDYGRPLDEGFDRILSLSHCCAKSVVHPARVPHLCYCLTPMRYAWDQFEAYFGAERIGRWSSAAMRPVMARLARWDRDTAGRADRYVAISHYVAGRIGRYYNRQATVVYPPVDTDFFHPDATTPERFALIVSALVPYKRVDVAIAACARAGVPLTIVGDGPERAALERDAPASTRFLGRVSDDEIRALYRRAAVALLPGEEDFGIVPLEAQACGRPVVALGRGGAVETVKHGETGLLVDELSAEAFADAIVDAVDRRFDASAIRRHAEQFGRSRFGDEIAALVAEPASW